MKAAPKKAAKTSAQKSVKKAAPKKAAKKVAKKSVKKAAPKKAAKKAVKKAAPKKAAKKAAKKASPKRASSKKRPAATVLPTSAVAPVPCNRSQRMSAGPSPRLPWRRERVSAITAN